MRKENKNNDFIQQFLPSVFDVFQRLNHWCHMDCFIDVLTTLLGFERGCIAVYAGSESSDFLKNILIWVPEMNEGLVGLEQHEGD